MTFTEMYTSLKELYRGLMFPKNPHAPKWTMSQIDEMDVHFFSDLLENKPAKKEVFLSDIW
ncbi:hypothetical protein ACQCT3_17975 [Sutcliffiella horikoshii]|uniref:hypothetical protein n=1 Tax=Sutcliffiella horikoshii TaxID=79883 RepID=UPI003CEEB933